MVVAAFQDMPATSLVVATHFVCVVVHDPTTLSTLSYLSLGIVSASPAFGIGECAEVLLGRYASRREEVMAQDEFSFNASGGLTSATFSLVDESQPVPQSRPQYQGGRK